jgi:hypothetical protein
LLLLLALFDTLLVAELILGMGLMLLVVIVFVIVRRKPPTQVQGAWQCVITGQLCPLQGGLVAC